MHLCVLCGSQNKQRFSLYTAITYRFYNRGRKCFVRGTKLVLKLDRYSFVLKELKTRKIEVSVEGKLSMFTEIHTAVKASTKLLPVTFPCTICTYMTPYKHKVFIYASLLMTLLIIPRYSNRLTY